MPTVFTIGHSNQPAAEFLALVANYGIEVVVDVRSNPYSRFRHFNREQLSKRLRDAGIDYLHLGDQLGGHPDSDEFYEGNRVAYERIAALPAFRRGIEQIRDESERRRLVLMCAEEDPSQCHRHPLLASALLEHGVQVFHLRRDGSVQDATTVEKQTNPQLALFEPDGEDFTWRSPKRIRRRGHS